ncbi:MAG: hypothetical protein K5988_11030, partial [Lachnospiraceae bacterium]|nr:hypothetical protein [Lachnospiraceae bacterium]
KDNPNNVPVDNNQNNNNNNNNNQNNNNNNNNNNQNNQNNNQNQQNNNNQSNNNQNNNQEQPKKKTAYRIKKVTTESYDDDGKFYDYFISDFTYNSDNQLISIVETRKSTGEFYGKSVYEYDKNGNKTKEIIYNPNGEIGGCIVFRYDNNGKLLNMSEVSPDGSQIYYSEEYVDGEVVGKIYYDSKGMPIEWVEYDLGSNGKKEIGFRYWYDEKGVEKHEQSEFYEYDGSGNCIHEHIEKNDGWIIQDTVYECDSHNNWTYKKYHYTEYESKNSYGTGQSWGYEIGYRHEYEYNERGDIVVDKYYLTEGNTWLSSVDYYEYEEYECE